MVKKIYIMFIAVILLTGCATSNKEDVVIETTAHPSIKNEENSIEEKKLKKTKLKEIELKETFRYVSKDYFYTDFEGESVVQTDVEDANTICQRNLYGELTDSYYMGKDFDGIFYIDEDWLYYSVEKKGIAKSIYRVPFSHENGKEYPEFSKKEFLFTEPKGLSGTDYTEDSFLQIMDNTIYYCAYHGLGSYNLETGKRKYYPVPKKLGEHMFAAGIQYMLVEGPYHDILVNMETGKSKVMKTDTPPWLRLGKDCYLPFPYIMLETDNILLDLNSGETIEVFSQEEGKRIAIEMRVPLDKNHISIDYIGYYNHRVYAEIQYSVTVTNKKGKKITAQDAICVSRNMDKEKNWTVEKEITAHSRKRIVKFYKKVKEGNYKVKKKYNVEIGEGITNGIFYFKGYYKKDDKMAIDIYDLDKKEFRVIGRNSPETFYPFYDNSHAMMYMCHTWQNIRHVAPILSQGESVWEQKQKLSGKYWK